MESPAPVRTTRPGPVDGRLRALLAELPEYVRPAEGGPGGVRHELASNENPFPPPPAVLAAAAAVLARGNRYPAMAAADLAAEVAGRLGTDAERVATGAGSLGVLRHLLELWCAPGGEVVHAWRSFEAYPILIRIAGARPVGVPLRGQRHDLPALAAAITPTTRVVLVCNPNNPTGTVVRERELRAFLDDVPPGVLVVLDEAYREFVRDRDVPDGVEFGRTRPNVVVLRTFSKAHGLAGLRVGYAVAHPEVAGALRKATSPFEVTAVAEAAAIAALGAPETAVRVRSLVAERDRVQRALVAGGWRVPWSEANFLWLDLGAPSADFAAECAREGIAVRAFAGEGVRVTVADRAVNDAFLAVAARFRADRVRS
uniref:Aromatic amino acid aminotransferase n=1 Tax=Streptoalloteichus sp. ATCC 53650 TaxID=756733 RepID=K4P0Z7_9PSEU|nr:phenylalanine aminotransferase [Streptoalloteichus sp. ATCC 53650]